MLQNVQHKPRNHNRPMPDVSSDGTPQPNNPKMVTSKLSQISSEDYHLKPVAKCPA